MTTFSDLSIPCKIGIIGGWVALIAYAVSFCVGFLMGVTGV